MASSSDRMPVIVGFGGIDAGGRWGGSSRPAFRSMVHDKGPYPDDVVVEQLRLMELCRKIGEDRYRFLPDGSERSAAELAATAMQRVKENLFVRRVPYDAARVPALRKLEAREIVLPRSGVPDPLPHGWSVESGPGDDLARVVIEPGNELYTWSTRPAAVSTAAAIPEGFQPYPPDAPGPAKRRVARNLWLGLFALNDAFKAAGLSFGEVSAVLPQDRVGIYFASAMGQVGPRGFYGYARAHLFGERPQSTQIPFSLSNTPGAFLAAYTTGSIGHISSDVGACATFMLNLHNALRDFRCGKRRFAIVGAADAAVYPWTIAGYEVMNALARDEDLPRDEHGRPIHRLASRPFGRNRLGFVVGEGAFVALLADRELVRELGLPVRGLLCDVACHSDGWKKSISGPGIGDYPALHGVLGSAARRFGIETLRHRSFVSAHGSSTPQNGVTEAQLYHRYARCFGVPRWRITAPKSFMGHSMGAAGGVQTLANLLSLETGVIPRIRNLDEVGVDPELEREEVQFLVENHEFEPGTLELAIAVSKGFGGFNVAEVLAGPELAREHVFEGASGAERTAWEAAREKRLASAEEHREAYLRGAHLTDYDASRPITTEALHLDGPERLGVDGYSPFEF